MSGIRILFLQQCFSIDTGIEELHTLKAKLMNLRDQLKQKKEIDATWLNKIVAECYQSISTITIKIEKEQTTYKVELECLKENNRCLIADLEEKSRGNLGDGEYNSSIVLLAIQNVN